MEADATVVKLEAKYVCAKCNDVLDEATMAQHPCFEDDGEATVLEYLEDQTNDGANEEETQIEVLEEPAPAVVEKSPKFRVKVTSSGRRGDWSDADVHRLLDIYIKNYKDLPMQKRLHNHYLWDRVMKDLKPYGNFSRFLVQAKIKKMKKAGKAIMEHGYESKWPYLGQVVELLKLEEESGVVGADEATEPETEGNESEEEDNDNENNEEEVTGLRRWTIAETRHLIEVYKKHLPRYFTGLEPRKIAWDEIISDLDYGLSSRFTMYQIRAKIRNAQNTFRHIVEKKRKKAVTHWPLFADLADLAKTERELAQSYGVPIGVYRWGGLEDPDAIVAARMWKRPKDGVDASAKSSGASSSQWNDEETRALLSSYKNYQAAFKISPSNDTKQRIWEKICQEVNEVHRKKVSVREVQLKIDAFIQMWYKNENGLTVEGLLPFYEEMQEIMSEERGIDEAYAPRSRVEGKRQAKLLDGDDSDEEYAPSPKRRKRMDNLPQWYVQYQKAAQRRHEDKLDRQEKLLSLLETLVARSQN